LKCEDELNPRHEMEGERTGITLLLSSSCVSSRFNSKTYIISDERREVDTLAVDQPGLGGTEPLGFVGRDLFRTFF
jgi:hypothetical protein